MSSAEAIEPPAGSSGDGSFERTAGHSRRGILSAIRIYPALLRIGLAEAVAYRAEFIVWILTTTMPLIMLALWSAVLADGGIAVSPVGGTFGQNDFTAYYLSAMIVRTITSCWAVWQINMEIQNGTLATQLLRPIHPFIGYSAIHLAAVPFRAMVAVPIAVVLLIATQGDAFGADPLGLALFPLALLGAWALVFFTAMAIGSLGLFITRSVAIYEVWLSAFAVFSGYLAPTAFLPTWVRDVGHWLPFRSMLGFPVELLIGRVPHSALPREFLLQWIYVLIHLLVALTVWKRGVRRLELVGG